MSAKRPKVSICMIVKNEEANLKRCLDSFLPIIRERWSELVIVDTGSTDRTVSIARQYTRNVHCKIFDPWSFADARNYGISLARGERILVIDADEQLKPGDANLYGLEDLLLNPDYDQYPTIYLKLHNFYSSEHRQYTEMIQARIFRNDGKPIYSERVHNIPRTEAPYLFASHIVFNHYGYVFIGNEKLRDEKTNRSLPLLLEALEADPDNLHAINHIVKTYWSSGDFAKVIEYGEKWIKGMEAVEFHVGWYSHLETVIQLVGAYVARGDIDNALRVKDICEERFTKRLVNIYFMLGNYYAGKNDYTAAEYFERGIQISREPGDVYEQLLCTNATMNVPVVMNWLAIHYFRNGDYDRSGKYINDGIQKNTYGINLRWDVFNEDEAGKRLIKDTVECR